MIALLVEMVLSVLFFIVAYALLVHLPLTIISKLLRRFIRVVTFGKVDLLLRDEKIAWGLLKEGEGYYSKDVTIRKARLNPIEPEVVKDDPADFMNAFYKEMRVVMEVRSDTISRLNPENILTPQMIRQMKQRNK